nr:DNA ligase [Poseidonibacter lekithochrous]
MKFSIIFSILFINSLALDIQKPKVYNKNEHNIQNWLMSEKLDGIRAYWNGKELLTKNGNKIYIPKELIKNYPIFHLDGELWTKRNDFENIQSIVLDKTPTKKWEEITYNIFEVPNQKGNFNQRITALKDWIKTNKNTNIRVINQIKCKNKKHLNTYLKILLDKKAEGIIIKNPDISYFTGRNKNILKVKKFKDMEGKVIAINYNINNTFKSLKIQLSNNIIFNLGGGFSNKEKINHPKIGDIVTFKYYGLTKYKKPKFASFLRIRKEE